MLLQNIFELDVSRLRVTYGAMGFSCMNSSQVGAC